MSREQRPAGTDARELAAMVKHDLGKYVAMRIGMVTGEPELDQPVAAAGSPTLRELLYLDILRTDGERTAWEVWDGLRPRLVSLQLGEDWSAAVNRIDDSVRQLRQRAVWLTRRQTEVSQEQVSGLREAALEVRKTSVDLMKVALILQGRGE